MVDENNKQTLEQQLRNDMFGKSSVNSEQTDFKEQADNFDARQKNLMDSVYTAHKNGRKNINDLLFDFDKQTAKDLGIEVSGFKEKVFGVVHKYLGMNQYRGALKGYVEDKKKNHSELASDVKLIDQKLYGGVEFKPSTSEEEFTERAREHEGLEKGLMYKLNESKELGRYVLATQVKREDSIAEIDSRLESIAEDLSSLSTGKSLSSEDELVKKNLQFEKENLTGTRTKLITSYNKTDSSLQKIKNDVMKYQSQVNSDMIALNTAEVSETQYDLMVSRLDNYFEKSENEVSLLRLAYTLKKRHKEIEKIGKVDDRITNESQNEFSQVINQQERITGMIKDKHQQSADNLTLSRSYKKIDRNDLENIFA